MKNKEFWKGAVAGALVVTCIGTGAFAGTGLAAKGTALGDRKCTSKLVYLEELIDRYYLGDKDEEKLQEERQSAASITSTSIDRSAIDGMNIEGESNPQNASENKPQPIKNDGPKVGRNDPCPCGSGKKYKNCCGRNQ